MVHICVIWAAPDSCFSHICRLCTLKLMKDQQVHSWSPLAPVIMKARKRKITLTMMTSRCLSGKQQRYSYSHISYPMNYLSNSNFIVVQVMLGHKQNFETIFFLHMSFTERIRDLVMFKVTQSLLRNDDPESAVPPSKYLRLTRSQLLK